MLTIKDLSYKLFKFPDGQPHVQVEKDQDNVYFIECSIKSPEDLFNLCQVLDAVDGGTKLVQINYLMGARYDRIMKEGDSFDLRVVAKILNAFEPLGVNILDPHSEVSTNLINKAKAIYNLSLYEAIEVSNGVLIVPDKGASKKTEMYQYFTKGITDVVYCDKVRDIEGDGRITLVVNNPELCEGRECVIIDDICDGGGTFISIANQIKPSKLSLCVTHGIFSKGLEVLSMFDKIYCTDSFTTLESNDKLQIINNNESTFVS